MKHILRDKRHVYYVQGLIGRYVFTAQQQAEEKTSEPYVK